MDKKLILDYEELPQDKKRIKWGTAILEKDEILWQGKSVDKLELNLARQIIFFLLNAIFVTCLIFEIGQPNRFVPLDLIGFLILALPFAYFFIYKSYQESKTEYVITKDAVMFRLFHKFKLQTFSIPMAEISSFSLENFDTRATIHIHTKSKPKFTTHNVIGGSPRFHPTIEHVENYQEAYELLEKSTEHRTGNKKSFKLPMANKSTLRVIRSIYYLLLFGIGFYLLSYYVFPTKTIQETVNSSIAAGNFTKYTTAGNHSFLLQDHFSNLKGKEIKLAYTYLTKIPKSIHIEGVSYTENLRGPMTNQMMKILLFATYGILMLILFTLLNRELCPQDDLKLILFLPVLLFFFLGLFFSLG